MSRTAAVAAFLLTAICLAQVFVTGCAILSQLLPRAHSMVPIQNVAVLVNLDRHEHASF